MEKALITIEELRIGKIEYGFDAEVYYYDHGESESDDSPACSEYEIISASPVSQISAWDTEKEEEYIVTDPNEIKQVMDWIDWEDELTATF